MVFARREAVHFFPPSSKRNFVSSKTTCKTANTATLAARAIAAAWVLQIILDDAKNKSMTYLSETLGRKFIAILTIDCAGLLSIMRAISSGVFYFHFPDPVFLLACLFPAIVT